MSSATTSRIKISKGEKLYISIYMYVNSKGPLTYKIFKNGVKYKSGSLNGTTVRSVDHKTFSVPAGKYSLRVYSASRKGTAYGGIGNE